MFNILRKKTVEVHCYTDNRTVFNLFQLKRAVDFYPKWWKDLPKFQDRASFLTIKSCYGFLELYKRSFVLQLWSDFTAVPSEKSTISYGDQSKEDESNDHMKVLAPSEDFGFQFHPPSQYKGMVDTSIHDVIKLISPWKMVCNENTNFMVTDLFYNKPLANDNFTILPGLLNFKYQNSINFFIRMKKTQIDFDVGMPIIMITPLTEKKIKFVHHLDMKSTLILESENKNGFPAFNHKVFKKIKLDKQENKIGKCPFGFGKYK